jgi:hypothetical protein
MRPRAQGPANGHPRFIRSGGRGDPEHLNACCCYEHGPGSGCGTVVEPRPTAPAALVGAGSLAGHCGRPSRALALGADARPAGSSPIALVVGLRILVVVIVLQVWGITRARCPGLLAVEALALTAPLFLVMFAGVYVVVAQDNAANFSTHELTRTDALYFTLTVLSTVGFA